MRYIATKTYLYFHTMTRLLDFPMYVNLLLILYLRTPIELRINYLESLLSVVKFVSIPSLAYIVINIILGKQVKI